MAGLMYFATKDKGGWLPCPAVSMPSSKVGFNGQTNYLNGGAYVRRSKAAHKEYDMAWNLITRDQARPILDIADGLWGDGTVHFIDPVTGDRNLLPQAWASPFQGIYDGVPLNGGARPTSVTTPANVNDYPVESAVYTVATATVEPTVWIPLPNGYTAWVGAHGTAGTGGAVQVRPTTGPTTYGSTTTLTLLPVTSTTRVNASFSSSSFTGVELSLAGNGTITLSGLIVQVLPDGVDPVEGGFISGQGNSGCKFADQPAYTPYSAALDRVGVSVRLVETGMWA